MVCTHQVPQTQPVQTRNTSLTPGKIPKPNEPEGLGVGWPSQPTDMDKLKALHEEVKARM